MARPKSKTKKILFAVEIIVLLLFIGGLYVYGQLNSKLDKINQPVLDDSKIKVNQEVQDSIDSQESTLTGYTTYALFGIDHRDKNTALGGENSDTIIIASVNNDTKDVKLVSVYRDTLLNLGNDTYSKANAAYAYGEAEQAITMLNTNLDLNISEYATVNFNALTTIIDDLGGLDMDMSYAEIVHMNNYCVETSEETGKDYTPIELPDRPDDIEAVQYHYHLNGVQATSYCRIRYTASMDMGRTERQRRVIGMMVDKAKAAGITTIFNIMDEVFPMISTSITKTEILNLIPTLMGYNIADTTGFPAKYKFADVKKASMVVADTLEDNVKELHKFLYGADENYQPSQNIVEANARIIELVGGADTLVDQSPIASNEAGNSSDIVWQGDGSGNYDYNDYGGSDYDNSYDNSYNNSYDSGNDYSGDDSGDYSDGSYDSGSDSGSSYDNGGDYSGGDYSGDSSGDGGFEDGSGY